MSKGTCWSDPEHAFRASEPFYQSLHGVQVKLVEAACKEYLLDLDLSLEQLCQLVLLWVRLGSMSALRATLRKLMRKPWLTPVAQAVAYVFQHLLQGDGTRLEAARKVLQSPSCGKMCELQVNSLLWCGLFCVRACKPFYLFSFLVLLLFLFLFLFLSLFCFVCFILFHFILLPIVKQKSSKMLHLVDACNLASTKYNACLQYLQAV